MLSSPLTPQSILVLRFSSLGDVLLTTPAMEALAKAWPKCRIFFATKEEMAPLLKGNPYITKIIALQKGETLFAFAKRLRALDAGAILDLHNKLRSKVLRALLWKWGRVVCTWKNRSIRDYIPLPLSYKNYHSRILFANRFHAATESLVGAALPRGFLRYFPSEDELAKAKALLEEQRAELGNKIIGIAMGSAWETKRWLGAYFIRLINKLRLHHMQVVLLGSAVERGWASAVQEQLGAQAIINLCGAPLRISAALLHYCRAFVCNDSGPMHIARAMGIPTLAIFGSTDPAMFDLESHYLAYKGIACSPCGFNGRPSCPRRHFRCMKELLPERIWELLQEALEGSARKPYLHA